MFEFNNPSLYDKKFIVGYCGDLDAVPDMLEYLDDITGKTKPPRAKLECVILTEDHKIFTFVNPSKWILVDEPCYAIGSGMHYALGAMKSGASPKEAVVAASKLDPHTGLGVKIMEYV